MLMNALALALLSTASFGILYKKCPKAIQNTVKRFPLVADVTVTFLTYSLFGSTLTALIGAAMCGLFTSGLIHIGNNPKKFFFLNHFIDMGRDMVGGWMETISEFGESYNTKHLASYEEFEAKLATQVPQAA